MAKMASIAGSVVGKIGGNVYSVNSGQQIVRAYQPNVANPSTELQVTNRAKFKLASQLAATFSPVLAISKNGMVSGRNQFVSDTMNYISVEHGEASVQLSKLQLTKSSIMLTGMSITVGQDNHVSGSLLGDVTRLGVTKVIYARFAATSINKILLISTTVVSDPGVDGHFTAELGGTSNLPTFFYAYGIIEDENSILAKYEDYQVAGATQIASLISSRSSAASGLKTTTTAYTVLNPQQNSVAAPSAEDSDSSRAAKGRK